MLFEGATLRQSMLTDTAASGAGHDLPRMNVSTACKFGVLRAEPWQALLVSAHGFVLVRSPGAATVG